MLFTIEASAPFSELSELMERTVAARVLVAADGELCGVVTTTDLLHALAKE